MEQNLIGIVIGVRHRRSFHVPEITGAIVDDILNEDGSPFHKEIYDRTEPLSDGLENTGRAIISSKNDNSLAIDKDNVVLDLKGDDLTKIISQIQTEYLPYLIKNVFNKYKIENINRVGVVFSFFEKDSEKTDALISKFTKNTFANPENLILRFSEKDITTESLVKKELFDHTNIIVTVQKRDGGTLSKFDFQFMYIPEVKNISDINFENFLSTAQAKLKSRFFNWFTPKTNEEE